MNQQIQHPLINPESSHYDDEKKTAIEELEEQLNLVEMMGACRFNIFKYKYRQDKKGQKQADLKKIETYENYLKFLESIEKQLFERAHNKCLHDAALWKVKRAYEYLGIELIYEAKTEG